MLSRAGSTVMDDFDPRMIDDRKTATDTIAQIHVLPAKDVVLVPHARVKEYLPRQEHGGSHENLDLLGGVRVEMLPATTVVFPAKQTGPAKKNGPMQERADGESLSEGNLHLTFPISQ